ncbi:ATP-dependent Clp protease adaptor protein ClpS-domain-containing protein [Tribonema minus]|uniref:ATP-dependent Clp protease adaptor protein ClpS-domain-containing protein n=1 Tax=Tribonema minus TaxID=303371 RepID=A0A835ZJP8_9STRA|nr:ATP-dependent Clp protease adaptor protein ClpS-domain-containing protein [Tribonema minus]
MRLYSEPARTAWTTPVTASMPMIEKKRQTGSGGGAAVLERPAPLIQPGTAEDQPSPADKFKVMLFNDNGNTREYVARSLVQVIGMTESDAYDIMTMAHKNGMALVGIWNLERAEAYSDQLKTRGLVSEIFPVE